MRAWESIYRPQAWTANDTGDGDTGPNNLQNSQRLVRRPSMQLARPSPSAARSIAPPALRVWCCTSMRHLSAGMSNAREGRRYLGSTTVNTNASGNATFSNIALTGYSGTVAAGELITATATTPSANGSTSEFSQGFVVNSSAGNSAPSLSQLVATEQGGLTINTSGNNSSLKSRMAARCSSAERRCRSSFSSVPGQSPAISAIHSFRMRLPTTGMQFTWVSFGSGASESITFQLGGNTVGISTDVDLFLDGNTHSLAFTWTQTSGAYAVYRDGVLIGSGTGLGSGQTLASGGQLAIGVDLDVGSNSWQPGGLFQGTLQDVRIFSDVRTAAEITASHRSDVPFNEGNMIANWRSKIFRLKGVSPTRSVAMTSTCAA